MTLKDYFLAQLEREAALTRKAVERVPEGQNGFKPHERSMELGYLAALVAGMLGWIAFMIDRDEIDFGDPSSESFRTKAVATRVDLLASFDAAVANARRALEGTSDDHLLHAMGLQDGRPDAPKGAAAFDDQRCCLQPPRAPSRTTHGLLAAGEFEGSCAVWAIGR